MNYVNYFKQQLSTFYSKEEVESFLFLLFDTKFNIGKTEIILGNSPLLSKEQESVLMDTIERLKDYEPIQYILGQTEFFGLRLKTDKRALIPRPETEELVEWAIAESSENSNILDVCTGSGCIAIALAKNIKHSAVSAVDISKEALELAEENAKLCGSSIKFILADVLSNFATDDYFDMIVSNPPYITSPEKKKMERNVVDYEPDIALFAPESSPIIFYDAIANLAKSNLKKEGKLLFEINPAFSSNIVDMLKSKGFENIQLRKDISNNYRMILASYC